MRAAPLARRASVRAPGRAPAKAVSSPGRVAPHRHQRAVGSERLCQRREVEVIPRIHRRSARRDSAPTWTSFAGLPRQREPARRDLALHQESVSVEMGSSTVGSHNALESLALDPRMDIRNDETVTEFICPKCGRTFEDWHSCQTHATSRKHAKFCMYDRRTLPTCLNAHSMLPAHPNSGYCDIQGRRRTIEDFHSIHLHPTHQFYGIFDGHTGNLASKYAAATAYKEVSKCLSGLDEHVIDTEMWMDKAQQNLTNAFRNIHDNFLKAVSFSPGRVMDQSGTTATIVYVMDSAVVIASVGDSRAIMSSHLRHQDGSVIMTAVPLTVDHVASDAREKELVEQRGGVVATSGSLPRVNGTLAITRSLGDACLSPWLSREPHVVAMSRRDILNECGYSESDGLPCFIVLASDGLWDVMSNQEAVDMVAHVVKDHDTRYRVSWEDGGAFQEAAEVLTQEAYVRGSSDNIGVCVIAID